MLPEIEAGEITRRTLPPRPSAVDDAAVFLDEASATTMLLESVRHAAADGNSFVLSPALELFALGNPHWLSRQLLLITWCVLWCERPIAMEALLFMHVNHLKLACAAMWAVRSSGWLPADGGAADSPGEARLRLMRAVEHAFINQQPGATHAGAEHKVRRAELLDTQAHFLDSLANVPETLRANRPELRTSLAKALIGASCASTLPAQLVLPTYTLSKRPYVVLRAPLNAVKVISTRERVVVLLVLELLHVDGSADGSALLPSRHVACASGGAAGAGPVTEDAERWRMGAPAVVHTAPCADLRISHEPSWQEVAIGVDGGPSEVAADDEGDASCAQTAAMRAVRLELRACGPACIAVALAHTRALGESSRSVCTANAPARVLKLTLTPCDGLAVRVRLSTCGKGASAAHSHAARDAPTLAPSHEAVRDSAAREASGRAWRTAQLAALQAHIESLRAREQGEPADEHEAWSRLPEAAATAADADVDMTARSWAEVRDVLATASPYSHLPGWELVPMLIKTNANMLVEQLAQQLLGEVRAIFELERTPLLLRTYEVRAVSPTAGFIEVIADAPSLHELKRRLGSASLRDHFRMCFGEGSADGDGDPISTVGARRPPYAQAVDNFACSLAANAVASYVLQVKDRHNGNILLTNTGAIVHVDFGFILGLAPGGAFAVEKAPFKLTAEWIELMGGPDAPMVQRFRSLCAVGMLALRRHAPRLLALTEAALALCRRGGPTAWKLLPCLQHGDQAVIAAMRSRLMLGLPDDVVCQRTNKLVDDSLAAWSTVLFDRYQQYTNSIEC